MKKQISLLTVMLFAISMLIVSCNQDVHTHTFEEQWTSDTTHHWKVATCGCEDAEVEKLEHNFGKWTTIKEATEDSEGIKEKSCSVCKYKATEVITKLAHTHKFSTILTSNESKHWYACSCGVKQDESEHSFGEYVSNNDATTEADGTKARTCSECGFKNVVVDEGSKLELAPEGFVVIPSGTFKMGSSAGYDYNKPVHSVIITKDFYMSKYEVTQAEYEKYCSYGENSPSSTYGDGENYPAYYVRWYDALVYCNNRSIAEGLTPCYSISGSINPSDWGTVPTTSNNTWDAVVCDWNANGYRLPTEAEWEYAARAGDNTVSSLTYSGTNDVDKLGDYAWYYRNSSDKTYVVGTKLPNAFGLYDMNGNVWEWCWNWYTSSYNITTEGGSDPTGAISGYERALRGGSYYFLSEYCTVSYRDGEKPYSHLSDIGFRVVRSCSK